MERIVTLKMDYGMLHCIFCAEPLDPPVLKCKGSHMACVRCESEPPRTVCHLCLEPSGGFKHDPAMDAVVSAAMVECSNSSCRSLVVYHKARDHKFECRFAPCTCPEPNCNFALPPAELVIHLAEVHSIEVHKLPPYNTTKVFQDVPVPEQRSPCRRLITQGEDGAVFVLTICAQGPTTIVSIVCVRAKACVWPQYMVSMWADRQSRYSAESVTVLLEASSSTVPGKVALEDLSSYLSVPSAYQRYNLFGETFRTLRFSIRIRKENDPHKGLHNDADAAALCSGADALLNLAMNTPRSNFPGVASDATPLVQDRLRNGDIPRRSTDDPGDDPMENDA